MPKNRGKKQAKHTESITRAKAMIENLQQQISAPYYIWGYAPSDDLDKGVSWPTTQTFPHQTLPSLYQQFRREVSQGRWTIIVMSDGSQKCIMLDTQLIEKSL